MTDFDSPAAVPHDPAPPMPSFLPDVPDDLILDPALLSGASLESLPEAAQAILIAPIDLDLEADIRPDGRTYVAHVHVRRRLIKAVGVGGWALVPTSRPRGAVNDERTVVMGWALKIYGRFFGMAWGSMSPEGKQSDDELLEGAKSSALTKIAKDLGIGLECWDRRWCDAFMESHCVQVWTNKDKPQWRRLTARPFFGERGPTDDSPNRDAYTRVGTAQTPSGAREESPRQAAPATTSAPATDAPLLPPGSELIIVAKKVKDGTSGKGAWRLYDVQTAKRKYAFFNDDKEDPTFNGDKLFEHCQMAMNEKIPVVCEFVERQGKRGTETILRAIRRATAPGSAGIS